MNRQTRPLAAVTGASSGIGLELARQFAAHGFDVIIAAEDTGILGAAADLRTQGTDIQAVQVDLASSDGVQTFYHKIKSHERPLDALAVNAGIGVNGEFADIALDDDLALIQLNVVSAVHLTKLAIADMVEQGHGRILFTSSVAATMPGPYYATYAASKAFLQSFAEAVRYEVKDKGVQITALMPGPTDTDFFDRAGMQDTKAGAGDKDDPAEVARQGYEALMADDDHVVAGSAKNKAQVIAAKVLPDPVKAGIHAAQTRPSGGKE